MQCAINLFNDLQAKPAKLAASVVDRWIFVPLVLVPAAIAGMFPRFLLAFALLDVCLAVGAWMIIGRGMHYQRRIARVTEWSC